MAKLDKKTRDSLKDSDFGIPSKRMYPLHDKEHVEAAVKLFGHASNEDKPELAYRILKKAKEFGMDSSGWTQVNLWAKKYKGENTNESTEEISDEKIVDSIANDESEKEDLTEGITEAAAGASLLTVKNQLMKMVGDAFKFIGGSLVPKFTMQSTEKPQVSFDVNAVGQNVEVTPKYNGAPDTMHKRKGIAFMRAADTIANFVQDVVNNFTGTPAAAMESVDYYDEYFEALLEYADELMDECEIEAYVAENPEMEFAICIGEDYLYDDEDFDAYFEGTEYDGEDQEIFIESDDVFTETARPYDDYLRKHQYDPATNTIIINGKRRDAGRKGSKKERNRLNKFLREHDYDPKTETIGSDIPDGVGGFKRIPFGITFMPGSEHRMSYKNMGPAASFRQDPRVNDPNQPVGIAVNKRILQGKPNQASTIVAHELGHEAYASDPQAYQTAYKYGERHAQDAANKYPDLATNIHDMNPEEYVADRYAITHNPYNRKPGDFKRSLAPFMANYYASVRKMLKKQVAAVQKEMEEDGMTMTAADFDDAIDIDEIREFTELALDSINEQIAEFQKILAENPNDGASQYQLQNLIASKKQLEEEIANDFPKTRAALESMKQNASNMANAIDASMDQQQVMVQAGLNSRLDHAAKIENERQADEIRANAQKRHELRAQLQEQIDSGQFTPKQVQQAQKKIARIDAFDAREQSGQPASKPQPKKKTTTSKKKNSAEDSSKKKTDNASTSKKASEPKKKSEEASAKSEPKKKEAAPEKNPASAKPAPAKKSETKPEETKK